MSQFLNVLLATPAQHSSIEVISDFSVFNSNLEVVPAIYPGQPFSVRWHYAGLLAAIQPKATVTATLLSKSRLAQLKASKLPYMAGGISEEVMGLESADQGVNRIGDNAVVLQAQVDGIDASLDESIAPYAVVEEFLADGHSWDISGGTGEHRHPTFHWKEAYLIGATFKNISQWITLTGTASLLESRSSSGPWTNRGTVPVQLGPGRNTALTFPERKQDWGWIAPAVFVVYGDLYRGFVYTIEFKLTDNFNNTYSFRSGTAAIAVVVSERKQAFGFSAMAAMAIALALYVISWLVTPVPAATVQGIAAGLGAAALDPPKPSKRYRERFGSLRVARKDLGPLLGPLSDAMAEVDLLSRLDRRLYAIEARYLGAREAKDDAAAAMQLADYGEATRAANLAAARMSSAVDATLAWLAANESIDTGRVRKALAEWSRNPEAAVNELTGVDAPSGEAIAKMLKSPELVSAAMEGLEANLLKLRSSLLVAANLAGRDRLRFARDTS